jgi:RNA polymerase sigma-70 factor (ECF subfamily)
MPVYDLYDIRECFHNLARGDASAFETIFELYKKRVFGVAFKMLKSETEAEEIVQDVFLSIWVGKANLSHINDPEAYLFTITYNTIYARLKKASRNQEILNTIINHLAQIQNTTDETIAAHETGKLINEAIQQLPPQQRAIYELSKQEGLSYTEIAERMHLSRNTVRNHLSEAMKTIRTFLKKAAMLLMLLFIILVN